MRLSFRLRPISSIAVSIHAPGRGATNARLCRLDASEFQFTHPGGVRPAWNGTPPARHSFNSRTREGCDGLFLITRGGYGRFQFTHPGGVRPFWQEHRPGDRWFQFTHPGGVRLSSSAIFPSPSRCFNSRTREGCDNSFNVGVWHFKVFQFTHPGGVRRSCSCSFVIVNWLFQFTHPGGVRRQRISDGGGVSCFNSRTREGCDRAVPHDQRNGRVSIHAPGRGATRVK